MESAAQRETLNERVLDWHRACLRYSTVGDMLPDDVEGEPEVFNATIQNADLPVLR